MCSLRILNRPCLHIPLSFPAFDLISLPRPFILVISPLDLTLSLSSSHPPPHEALQKSRRSVTSLSL